MAGTTLCTLANYIVLGLLIACMLFAAAKAIPRRGSYPRRREAAGAQSRAVLKKFIKMNQDRNAATLPLPRRAVEIPCSSRQLDEAQPRATHHE
jgi:hypothetical protein